MNINLKRVLSTVLTTSMCLAMVNGFNGLDYNAESSEPIKIMPIGDSITDGYGLQGSYRKYLYQSLVENGFNVDMVGFNGNNEENYYDSTTNSTITYDGNHCGYSGYAIQQMTSGEYRNGIYETLQNGNMVQSCNPDIVLLQIGTNDIISNYNDGIIDRLENLVDYILSNMNQDGVIFVTTIPYMNANNNEVYSWFSHYDDYYTISQSELAQEIIDCIDSYNAQIKEFVQKRQSQGYTNIQFADINSVVDYETELRDGVHPNDKGYQDMGMYWNQVLKSYLGSDVPSSEETTITTEDTSQITDETTITTEETSQITDETTITTEDVPQNANGDVNFDGIVNSTDVILIKKHILGMVNLNQSQTYSADLNGDGLVSIFDLIALKSRLFK